METTTIFSTPARKVGIVSAVGTAVVIVFYAVTLIIGFLTLKSPTEPIVEPLFSMLEISILILMPLILAMMATIHAWASAELKIYSFLALVCMSIATGITCSVHFVILAIGRHPDFSELAWAPTLISFRWPSVAYALDILAWDLFFALSLLAAAAVFRGGRLIAVIRITLIASAALSLIGLSGAIIGNMQVRNIGIIGYVGIFSLVAILLARFFYEVKPR